MSLRTEKYMAHKVITVDRARELLAYDPDTGVLRWRVYRNHNARPGDVAGTDCRGYRYVFADKKGYIAHRLAWLLHYGEWPSMTIDHIDGNKDNNRIENLRDVSVLINAQNQKRASSKSKSGVLGVSRYHNKYKARILIDGKEVYLGLFASIESASDAYQEAKRKNHPGYVQ